MIEPRGDNGNKNIIATKLSMWNVKRTSCARNNNRLKKENFHGVSTTMSELALKEKEVFDSHQTLITHLRWS